MAEVSFFFFFISDVTYSRKRCLFTVKNSSTSGESVFHLGHFPPVETNMRFPAALIAVFLQNPAKCPGTLLQKIHSKKFTTMWKNRNSSPTAHNTSNKSDLLSEQRQRSLSHNSS